MNFKIIILLTILIAGCSSERPKNLGIKLNHLNSCNKKNCVSSTNASTDDSFIEPIKMIEPIEVAQEKLSKIILKNKQAKIIKLNPSYIYAEFTSSVFQLVDDVEFHLSKTSKKIFIRSASRTGKYDFGVNRKRIEEIRFKYHQNDVN